jgi:D-alanyl-D-alanine carboxypeptidase
MLPSGNDAAMCLADWAGKLLSSKTEIKDAVKIFVQEMNKSAKILGLKDTRFGNPHGLPHT